MKLAVEIISDSLRIHTHVIDIISAFLALQFQVNVVAIESLMQEFKAVSKEVNFHHKHLLGSHSISFLTDRETCTRDRVLDIEIITNRPIF